jgi:alpha-L-fucosidase 2
MLTNRPPLVTAPAALVLDGGWQFRVYGQVRGAVASLALRLRLDAYPLGGPAGLLTGDLDRPGVPTLRILPDGSVVLDICDQVRGLRAPLCLLPGRWSTIVVRYDRSAGHAELRVDGQATRATALRAEVGIDLDTLTIGGPRLAGTTEAFRGLLGEVRLADRWWSDPEAENPFALAEDASTTGWWTLTGIRPAARPGRWQVTSRCAERDEAANSIRLDAVDGGGGSIGSIGAYLIPAGLSQPVPVAGITHQALGWLGFNDARTSALSTVPAWSWEAGLPTGNGEHGALILGRPLDEVVVLNRAGLYLPLHPPIAPPAQAQHLPEIRKKLIAGAFQAAADLVVAQSQRDGYTSEKRWTDPFIPAAFLRLDHRHRGEVVDYLRGTDYADGTVATAWSDDRGGFCRRTIVSRSDDVVVTDVRGPTGSLDVDLALLAHEPETALDGVVPNAPVGPATTRIESGWLICRQAYARSWPGSIRAALTVARVVVAGGSMAAGDALHIRRADRILILVRTAIERDGDTANDLIARLQEGLAVLPAQAALLWARHQAIQVPLFAACQLGLGATVAEHLHTVAELHADTRIGAANRALVEKTFAACRHLALGASGAHFPPNLQGIWGGSWRASWSGDYTQNGNLQTAVSGHLPGNLAPALEGFFAYQESLVPQYRENARILFGARGIQVPSRTSTHGLLNHFDGTWPMTFWTAGAAWNARFFFDRWLYTGDREFLATRALPFMREAVLFYEDFLAGTGTAHFRPSYSPENDSPATGSQATVDAAMDVGAARQLLEDLLSLADTGLVTAEELTRWRRLRDRLPPFRITDDGALAEWGDPRLTDRHEHRHASQLYAFYDGLPEWAEGDDALLDAARVTVDRRMRHRRAAGGGIMAFGMVQLGCAAASLRLATDTGDIIDWLVNRFFFPESLVSAHNPRHVFNVDIAGGLPRLMLLALADSRPGRISLLPARPPQWTTGEVRGLACRGGVVLDRLTWSPTAIEVTLTSIAAQRITLQLPDGGSSCVDLPAGTATLRRFTLLPSSPALAAAG